MSKPEVMTITGAGVVCPAGIGLPALLSMAPWGGESTALGTFQRVDLTLPELVRWQKEGRMRRASSISLTLLAAAHQALEQDAASHPTAMSDTGMVYVSYTGCLVYSHRFYEEVVRNGRKYASPLLFPETVYNSPASHAAAVLGVRGACYTLVGDASAWADALDIASLWLELGHCQRVVVAASEEADPLLLEAYRAAGWHRHGRQLAVGEGGGAVVVRRGYADHACCIRRISTGFPFRTARQARAAASACLRSFPSDIPIYPTAAGTWHEPLENSLLQNRPVVRTGLPVFGDTGAAGAAWHMLRALAQAEAAPRQIIPFWGLNHQVSALQLGQPAGGEGFSG